MARLKRIFVLAGQAEAIALCEALDERIGLSIVLDPRLGEVGRRDLPRRAELRAPARSAAGLMTALKWDRAQAVVDASDPFADAASQEALLACRALGLPLIQLRRPGFDAAALGDSVRRTASIEETPLALPPFARAFIQLPLDRLAPFGARPLVWYLVRAQRPPAGRFPFKRGDFAVGAAPFTPAHERILFEDYRIDHLVIGDVGGERAAPTLAAARERGARIILVDPPAPPPPPPNGRRVESVADALGALADC